MPRWTLRRQLTLLYAGPFLISGGVLLFVPLLGASQSVPAGTGAEPPGPADAGVDVLQRILTLSAASLAVMFAVSIVIGWAVAGRFLRPLRAMIDTARDISATNLHRRLGPTGRRDEFAELASTLDALFARLESSFEAQRRFVASASHELRTPLTAERTILQVALADPGATTGDLRAACREVLALGAGQARLIDALLTLATSERGLDQTAPFDLAAVARAALATRADTSVTVTSTLRATPVEGDERLAEILVANLVDNALKHNVEGGRVTVDVRPSVLTVENTGPAVPPTELDRLFQPFQRLGAQRVRATTDGYGLGLAIVRAIATAHGATVTADARTGGGLRVTVTFP